MTRALRGVGVGFRREIAEALLSTTRTVDWLELVSENYIGAEGRPKDQLARCIDKYPLVFHGVTLSPGSAPDLDYLSALKALAQGADAPFVSDHICFSRTRDQEWFDLLPLPLCKEAADLVVHSARTAQQIVGLPLLLENITRYAEMPGSVWSECEFLKYILEGSGAKLLLDITNVYVNSVNLGFDAFARTEQLLENLGDYVGQLHLAGPTWDGDRLIDSHAAKVPEVVWELYAMALKRCGPVPTLIEWDARIPDLDAVLDEADKARRLMDHHA
jgi:uncharacterized protein